MLADPNSTYHQAETALWSAWKEASDESARHQLFVHYQPLARRIASRLYRERQLGDLEFADALQFACIGLLEAIDHYRPELGVPFRYYGNRRIAGAVLDGLAHLTEKRAQAQTASRARKDRLASLKSAHSSRGGSLDLNNALAELGEIATELALGFMLEDSGLLNFEMADPSPSPYDSLAWRGLTERLRAELDRLPERERLILTYHYLGAISFEQIARQMSLSKGRISQLHRSAIGTLRKRLLKAGISTLKAEY